MRRIVIRILLVFAAVLLLAALTVQIVLLTNIPRNIVVRALEKQLHLRAETRTLSTGWLGHTTLHDVSFALPLSDMPILSTETLTVRHTSLIPLLFGRDLTITCLEFQHPDIRIVRGSDGQWNVQPIVQLLENGSIGNNGSPSPSPLPEIDLIDGSVQIVDGDRQTTIDQLHFKGEPAGLLAWKAELSVADRVKLDARLVPGGTWEHEATLNFSGVAGWAQPWFKLPGDLAASLHWRGRLQTGGIQGRLDATHLQAAGCSAVGGIDVSQNDQGLNLRPDNLLFTTPSGAIRQFTVVSGGIRYQNKIVRADSLQLAAYGGPASLTGYYDLAAGTGELSAAWDQLALPGKILHGGNLAVKLLRPFPTRMVVEGSLVSYATTPQGPWRAMFHFGGQDESDSDFSWHVNASELVWNRRNPIRLDGLEALGSIHHPAFGPATVMLDSLQLPDKQAMRGAGIYSLADRSWTLKISGERLPVQVLENRLIGFDLDANGNSSVITLNRFALTQAQTVVLASGAYRFGVPKPVIASISLSSPPAAATESGEEPLLEGAMRGDVGVGGTLLPMDLSLTGHLYGRAVRVARRDIGDVALRVSGEVNPDHAQLQTERLRALGGEWSFRTTYVFADELLDADLQVAGLPLQSIGAAADTNALRGTVAGEWDAFFPKLPMNLRNIRLRGQGWIHDFGCGPLYADDVHFGTTMDAGSLSVNPITLSLGATGRGSGSLNWNIDQPRRFEGAISVSDWPVQLGKLLAIAKLDAPAFAINLPEPASGPSPATPLGVDAASLHAEASLQYDNRPLGDFSLDGNVDGQLTQITDLHGALLDAPVTATGRIDLARPLNSQGRISFDHLSAARIATVFPQAIGLAGTMRGAISLEPATSQHPLEPLALHLQTIPDKASFRSLAIGVLNLNAFMNTDRIVLDDRPGHDSTLDIAGGSVRIWGRAGHPDTGVFSSQAELQLSDLDLNQLVQCVNPKGKPTPGKLGGNIMLLYNSRTGDAPPAEASAPGEPVVSPAVRKFVQTVYGESTLSLTGSDVATLPIFSDLYNFFSLGGAGAGPIGNGTLDARLEGGTLFISQMHYFNRGTDALAELTSPNMWDFPHNQMTGNAVASLQPLAALKLPLVADVQSALDALQGNLRSLRISGTWDNMRTTPIALSEMAKEMRDLLIGNIGH